MDIIQFDFCNPQSQRLADLYGHQYDLNSAIRFCDLHIEIDPTETGIDVKEVMRREHTRDALCRAAFTSYGRCFGHGIRSGLNKDFVGRLNDDLKQRHQQVRDLRDKWVAHSVNHFDDIRIRIQAAVDESGEVQSRSIFMAAQMVGTFVMAWMIAYRELFKAVLLLVDEEINNETTALFKIVSKMNSSELMVLERVDGTPLERKSWNPSKNRSRF